MDRNVDISDMNEIMEEITAIKSFLTTIHPYISIPAMALFMAPMAVQLFVIPDMVALEVVLNIGLTLQLSSGKKYSNRIQLTFIYSWKWP